MGNRMTYASEERKQIDFAEKAAKAFKKNPLFTSFGDIEPGGYIALRWGMGNDCVLVLKLDEYFQPVNYQQLIRDVE